MAKIRYLNRKSLVRTELLKDAFAGRFPTYAQLGSRVGIPKQGPWKPLLDVISGEETDAGYPDLTFLVRNSKGYPGQIGFVATGGKPTPQQISLAKREVQKVIDLYCPGTINPY